MESQTLVTDGIDDGSARRIQSKIEEGKEIIAKASRLKYRMARDQEIE